MSFAEQVKKGQRFHKALNTKSSQLETMSQDLVVARQELKTNQHMVTELQSELAAAQVQVNCYNYVLKNVLCFCPDGQKFNFLCLKHSSFVLEMRSIARYSKLILFAWVCMFVLAAST